MDVLRNREVRRVGRVESTICNLPEKGTEERSRVREKSDARFVKEVERRERKHVGDGTIENAKDKAELTERWQSC